MEQQLRIVVADDEPLARRRLVRLLQDCGLEEVREFGNVPALLAGLEEGPRPDVVFLDMDMPGGTGMEALAELDRTIPVVFVTAFPEHAAKAFDLDATDYMVKPVFKERLERALHKVRQKLGLVAATASPEPSTAARSTRFPAKAGDGHVFLELKRVTHFTFEEGVVWAWCGGRRFTAPWKSLVEVETAFPDRGMIRIQRHILLRPEMVVGHRPLPNGRALVRVGEGLELEVSRSMTPAVRSALGLSKD